MRKVKKAKNKTRKVVKVTEHSKSNELKVSDHPRSTQRPLRAEAKLPQSVSSQWVQPRGTLNQPPGFTTGPTLRSGHGPKPQGVLPATGYLYNNTHLTRFCHDGGRNPGPRRGRPAMHRPTRDTPGDRCGSRTPNSQTHTHMYSLGGDGAVSQSHRTL